jgi:glucose-1-phosphate thymidylyltransferase
MPHKGVLVFADRRPSQNGCTCGSSQLPALEHVANRPIVHHVLDAMRAAGVDELIVAGPADLLIDVRAHVSAYDPRLPLPVQYVFGGQDAGADGAIRAAAPLVGAAPCIVHVADGLLDEPLTPHVDTLHKGSIDLVLLCPSPPFGEPPGRALEPETPLPSVAGLLVEAGIGVFGPGAFRQACQAEVEREAYGLGDLAQRLSDDGGQVHLSLAEGWRRYRGNPKDLLEVNRLALDLLSPQLRPAAGSSNRIEGRVQIDPTAKVTTSVIVGPVVVGPGAEVTDAYVGPYTSIGSGARIEGAEIERSIISPGACVMHVGARLVSSLVGRGAHVFRDFSLPRAMRLRVGEGDEIALC